MIEIDETTLITTFNNGTVEIRAMLLALFPTVAFPANITEQVTTLAQACTITGVNLASVSAISLPAGLNDTAIRAFINLTIIHQALNEGWVADANNLAQLKCYVWQELQDIGSLTNGAPFLSAAGLASSAICLALKDEALARYSGTQFLAYWQDLAVLDSIEAL